MTPGVCEKVRKNTIYHEFHSRKKQFSTNSLLREFHINLNKMWSQCSSFSNIIYCSLVIGFIVLSLTLLSIVMDPSGSGSISYWLELYQETMRDYSKVEFGELACSAFFPLVYCSKILKKLWNFFSDKTRNQF